MIPPWLDALTRIDTPAVLVTVAFTQGSVPREAGACMLVWPDRQADTVGGGHLEFQALALARDMLRQAGGMKNRLQRLPLGPTLGQCCGGVVTLVFERVLPSEHAGFHALAERLRAGLGSWRVVPLADGIGPSFHDRDGALLCAPAQDEDVRHEVRSAFDSQTPGAASGSRWLLLPCDPAPELLYLFGAGHVGAAIVHALANLPCRVSWIDERESLTPRWLPANTLFEATDTPEAVIASAPPGAGFLVLTHSHALDLRLAEQILRRGDAGWFGLIGSRTKRRQFERRLRQRDIDDAALASMTCPIGLPGIDGKEPGTIAIAVAAQLLQVWQARARERAGKQMAGASQRRAS